MGEGKGGSSMKGTFTEFYSMPSYFGMRMINGGRAPVGLILLTRERSACGHHLILLGFFVQESPPCH